MPNKQTIVKKCPYCGKKTFRRLDIFSDHIMWKCKSCAKTESEKLFPIQKKIMYLDQLVYSLILKSSKKKKGDKWDKLGKLITQLVEDQIIICPYSTVHQTETELYEKYYEEITELYRKFSLGIHFKHPFYIEQRQLSQSLNNFLGRNSQEVHDFTWSQAFSKNPNQWGGRFSIFVNIKVDLEAVKKRENLKKKTQKKMQLHYDNVLKKEKKTFEEDFNIEKKFLAEVILSNHQKNKELLNKIMFGEKQPKAIFDLLNDHVDWILPRIEKSNKTKSKASLIMMRFLSSEEFYQTPYVYIWAYLFAALNQKVRTSKRKAEEGDYFDIRAISHYLPYCDVMLIDNEFRGILEERGATVLKKFNTIVISGKTLDTLFELFDKWVENSRVDGIKKIYKSLDHTSIF